MRQRRDDVLDEAIRNMLLIEVEAHVRERQDRNRRPVQDGESRPVAGRMRARDRRSVRPWIIARRDSLVWLSTIDRVLSEKSPVSSLSTVDLPSLVLKANCSRDMRSRAM